jgi:signal transduction histidine kinase/ketosteroid isomerase-like protein
LASAIHGIDPDVSWRTTADALVDGGTLALVSYFGLQEPGSAGNHQAGDGPSRCRRVSATDASSLRSAHRTLPLVANVRVVAKIGQAPGLRLVGTHRYRPDRTPLTGQHSVDLRSLVARHHKSFNDRDLDGLSKVFDEDVEVVVDGAPLHGVAAVLGYLAATFREFPQVRISDARVLAESGDTIVSEHRIVNGDPSGGPVRTSSVCEIYHVRDGRVVAYKSYHAPNADCADVGNVPSRIEESKIAEDQAALRRVATLVARGVLQDELFAAVNEEVGRLVGADPTSLMRFEAEDTVTLVAAWSIQDAGFPIGARQPVDDELRSVRDDARVLRFGPMELPLDAPFVEEARQFGVRSGVVVPIVVDDRVWGAAFAGSTREQPFPEDVTARIAGFTELVATAIANTEARTQVERLADEQAALRRVATLVARGAAPEEVFAAVTEEVARLFVADLATMCRYESDGTYTIVASARTPFPVGSRWPLGGKNLATLVFETGGPSRIENYAEASGPLADEVRAVGGRSAVGAPIIVEDRLWGATGVVASREQPLPTDTEARLAAFMELVATAIANTEARMEVVASRARIVAAADEERRRVVRDLHDGAQQRLVVTVMTLKQAHSALQNDEHDLPDLLSKALDHAEQATAELRELAHGILPGVLAHGGLRAGVDALASRMPVPVDIDVPVDRLPAAVEATAYFVIAEALTNVAKHADAGRAEVMARIEHGTLAVHVRDDGVGGARRGGGSGLIGLADRVAALDGELRVDSPTDSGTIVSAAIPLPC